MKKTSATQWLIEESKDKPVGERYSFGEVVELIYDAFIIGASWQGSQGWISVEDRLPVRPEKKEYINVQCGYYSPKGNFIQFIGFYAEKHKVPFEDYDNDDNEYDEVEEANGTMYLKEGWYELVETPSGQYDEIYMQRTVTHWQPLLSPPIKESRKE